MQPADTESFQSYRCFLKIPFFVFVAATSAFACWISRSTVSSLRYRVDFKQAQLQSVMNRVIATALRENKDIITTSIKEEVTADVMRQFDAVMPA